MRKKSKLLTSILTIVCIVLISIISFGGIYVQDKNSMKNVLPEYTLAKDLKGYRMVEIKATEEETDEEEKNEDEAAQENSEDEKEEVAQEGSEEEKKEEVAEEGKEENNNKDKQKEREEKYNKSKKIIEKRLKTMGVSNYTIRSDKETGNIVMEFPENDDTDRVVGQFATTGKFEIVDKDTQELLIDNNDIDNVRAGYGQSNGIPAVFINIQFNKEGTAKFKDITNKYVQTVVTKEKTEEEATEEENVEESEKEEATSEEKEDETETITKEVTLKLDGIEMLSMYFPREVTNGILQLTMGDSSSNTQKQFNTYLKDAANLAAVLDSGMLPTDYEVTLNQYIAVNKTSTLMVAIIIPIIVLVIGIAYLIVKYKLKGVLAGISVIGYIAVLLLAVRYFNVGISFAGVLTMAFSTALSYLMVVNMLKEEEKLKAIGKWIIILIPALIVSIVFTFNNLLIGEVLFWGVTLAVLYHISISNLLLKD